MNTLRRLSYIQGPTFYFLFSLCFSLAISLASLKFWTLKGLLGLSLLRSSARITLNFSKSCYIDKESSCCTFSMFSWLENLWVIVVWLPLGWFMLLVEKSTRLDVIVGNRTTITNIHFLFHGISKRRLPTDGANNVVMLSFPGWDVGYEPARAKRMSARLAWQPLWYLSQYLMYDNESITYLRCSLHLGYHDIDL